MNATKIVEIGRQEIYKNSLIFMCYGNIWPLYCLDFIQSMYQSGRVSVKNKKNDKSYYVCGFKNLHKTYKHPWL